MKQLTALFLLLIMAFHGIAAEAAEGPLHVITSFSILADIARNVGGDTIEVTSLVGRNADAHTYQPTPEDAKAVANADLIFISGLGFEGWMPRLVEASGAKATVVNLSDGLKGRILATPNGAVDPHVWQDISNGRIYAREMADALERVQPARRARIEIAAKAYDRHLAQADEFIRRQFAAIPPAQRKVVINHDSFGYFGAAYGVAFLTPVGFSTDAEPSAADMAKLITQIKTEHVRTLFLENMGSPRLIEQIAADTGAKIGGTLYSDALSGEFGAAPTYVKMFRNNMALLKAAMEANGP